LPFSRSILWQQEALDEEATGPTLALIRMPTRFANLAAVLLVAASIAACASSGNQAATASANESGPGCTLRPQDSTFALLGPVYRDCAVTTKAFLLTKDIRPNFQPAPGTVRNGSCYSADLEYVVNEKGEVEMKTAHVVKTNNQAYADAIVSILPQWKFGPAKLNDVPVRQIVTEKVSMQTMVVVAPAGSKPNVSSARPPKSPSC
jgi:hypothetical protein